MSEHHPRGSEHPTPGDLGPQAAAMRALGENSDRDTPEAHGTVHASVGPEQTTAMRAAFARLRDQQPSRDPNSREVLEAAQRMREIAYNAVGALADIIPTAGPNTVREFVGNRRVSEDGDGDRRPALREELLRVRRILADPALTAAAERDYKNFRTTELAGTALRGIDTMVAETGNVSVPQDTLNTLTRQLGMDQEIAAPETPAPPAVAERDTPTTLEALTQTGQLTADHIRDLSERAHMQLYNAQRSEYGPNGLDWARVSLQALRDIAADPTAASILLYGSEGEPRDEERTALYAAGPLSALARRAKRTSFTRSGLPPAAETMAIDPAGVPGALEGIQAVVCDTNLDYTEDGRQAQRHRAYAAGEALGALRRVAEIKGSVVLPAGTRDQFARVLSARGDRQSAEANS